MVFNLFPGSNASILAKGAMMAGGTGPVRMKKGPGLLGSIMGVFIGILLVLGSPIAMWYAQSQHTAKDFASATHVEATSGASGYIKFSGAPELLDAPSACVESSCIYQKESQQELITRQELVCGSSVQNTETQRILRQNGTECDESGNCVPCYDVEKDTWEEQDVIYSIYDVKVGDFTVTPTQSTIYLDTVEKTVETGYSAAGNETRSVYDYFPTPATLMVAGTSNGSVVTGGDMTFVLSQYDDAGTYDALRARDKSAQMMLWVVTFLMLFFGFSMILGPLSWLGRQMRFVPVVGPLLAQGSGMLITLAALIMAIPLWLLIFVLVVLIKVWWLALIILAVIIGLIVWRVSSKKDAASSPVPKA